MALFIEADTAAVAFGFIFIGFFFKQLLICTVAGIVLARLTVMRDRSFHVAQLPVAGGQPVLQIREGLVDCGGLEICGDRHGVAEHRVARQPDQLAGPRRTRRAHEHREVGVEVVLLQTIGLERGMHRSCAAVAVDDGDGVLSLQRGHPRHDEIEIVLARHDDQAATFAELATSSSDQVGEFGVGDLDVVGDEGGGRTSATKTGDAERVEWGCVADRCRVSSREIERAHRSVR